jgi:hypothetical protein
MHFVTPDLNDPSQREEERRSPSDEAAMEILYADVGDTIGRGCSNLSVDDEAPIPCDSVLESKVDELLPSDDKELNVKDDIHVGGGSSEAHFDNEDEGRRADATRAPPNRRVRLNELCAKVFFGASAETLVFASRVSVSTAISSLFLLAFPPSETWEYGVWVYVTCAMITWQPSLDAGTALKKLIERIAGTLLGAAMAFVVGYSAISIGNEKGQAVFLGFAFAVEGFLYPYLADRLGYRNSYGAVIGNMTFGLALSAFYVNQADSQPWIIPLYRVINVMLGCFIAAFVSLVVYPVSTKTLLVKLTTDLMASTGRNTEMTLQSASDSFVRGTKLRPISELLSMVNDPDPVHKSYVKNLEGWKCCRLLTPILKYDPWFWMMDEGDRGMFRNAMIILVARTFRVQMNAVLLDSILRSDAEKSGPKEAIEMLPAIGQRISTVMNVREIDFDVRKEALRELLVDYLPKIRAHAIRASQLYSGAQTIEFSMLEAKLMSGSQTLPFDFLHHQGGQWKLMCPLLEQLILRVAKLHYCFQRYHSYAVKAKYGGCSI